MDNTTNTTTTTTTTTDPMIAACLGMGMAPTEIAYMLLCAGKEHLALQALGPDALGAAQVRRAKEVQEIAKAATARSAKDPDPTAAVWGPCLDAAWAAAQDYYKNHMILPHGAPPTLAEFLASVVHPAGTINRRRDKPRNAEGWAQAADGKWWKDISGTPKGSMGKDVGGGMHMVIRLPASQQSHGGK